ncbi:hypothetical protein VTN77DRAFT_7915 [Rasamsonia byssochlamydoides]|uniref:uncharacterized protein n=1 Tax=Rasamsonia byssochlamydoides TaxID=89139 RepID=UPI003742DBE5
MSCKQDNYMPPDDNHPCRKWQIHHQNFPSNTPPAQQSVLPRHHLRLHLLLHVLSRHGHRGLCASAHRAGAPCHQRRGILVWNRFSGCADHLAAHLRGLYLRGGHEDLHPGCHERVSRCEHLLCGCAEYCLVDCCESGRCHAHSISSVCLVTEKATGPRMRRWRHQRSGQRHYHGDDAPPGTREVRQPGRNVCSNWSCIWRCSGRCHRRADHLEAVSEPAKEMKFWDRN